MQLSILLFKVAAFVYLGRSASQLYKSVFCARVNGTLCLSPIVRFMPVHCFVGCGCAPRSGRNGNALHSVRLATLGFFMNVNVVVRWNVCMFSRCGGSVWAWGSARSKRLPCPFCFSRACAPGCVLCWVFVFALARLLASRLPLAFPCGRFCPLLFLIIARCTR
jgi:hypothetical protein